jgi:hypothetical protein
MGRGEQYILAQLISSNNDWHDGWFYLHNDDDGFRGSPAGS